MARHIRCYIPGYFQIGMTVVLPEDRAHHLCRVLRLQIGTQVELFDGQGATYRAELINAKPKTAALKILESGMIQTAPPSCSMHLAMSLIKPDRWDIALQKAVELGVTTITPLETAYSSIRIHIDQLEKKRTHWQGVIVAAAEQCGQNRLPLLHPPTPLNSWLQALKDGPCLFLDTETTESILLAQIAQPTHLSFLVGPEGGFNSDEHQACYAAGLLPWHLGPRTLRAETAALVGLTLLQAQFGDLQALPSKK